jgi:hypothetical protein
VAEIFDFLVKQKHKNESIEHGLLSLLSSSYGMDATFFSKGLFQSVVEHSTPEE